ncbi:unnamed protein product [Agarophyton chilense]|eukprot:gb/GEZJ01003020.1/.p1 GENE.gb/GEZJ01003020.1/~~gb/GEZJ01003020.1/.p1  ORF type:complete len:1254 (-),score=233.89 gb/GEZJ01003020.1/:1554-5315(-)
MSVPYSCRITVIQATGEAGKCFEFDTKTWCVLGSHPDCDIRIKHRFNAPLHALVFVRPDGVHLQGIHPDVPVVHSRTGTKLVKESEIPLLPGDNFFLGDRGFRVDFQSPTQQHSKSPSLLVPGKIRPQAKGAEKAASERKIIFKTQASEKKRKPKRRVSLVVDASGERFVAQNRDTERLLSETQRARLSESESSKTLSKSDGAENDAHVDRARTETKMHDNEETVVLQPTKAHEGINHVSEVEVVVGAEEKPIHQNTLTGTNNGICFSTSTKTLDHKVSLPPTPKTRKPMRMAKSASKHGTLTMRERKSIIYSRLSLGLSALPAKHEMTGDLQTNPTVAFVSRAPDSSESKIDLSPQQNSNRVSSQDFVEKNLVRSPLVDKSPILNIQPASKRSENLIKECRTPSAINKSSGSVLRSSKSTGRSKKRSVAFAPKIELERGTHYSPFRPSRPKKSSVEATNSYIASESTSTDAGEVSSDKQETLFNGFMPLDTGGRDEFATEKNKEDDKETVIDLQSQLEKETPEEQKNRDSSADAPESDSGKSLNTGDSADSSTSGLTGAITSLFKRLSGGKERDTSEDKSDTKCSPGNLQTSDSGYEKVGDCNASTEPLMSVDEIQDLSTSKQMSVSRRLSFFDKVLGAAAAVRNVMGDVDDLDTTQEPSLGNGEDLSGTESGPVAMDKRRTERSISRGETIIPPSDQEDNANTASNADKVVRQSTELRSDGEEPSANGMHSEAASSGEWSVLNGLNQGTSSDIILAKLTKGIGEPLSVDKDLADKLSEGSEYVESLDRTTSFDTNSIYSQDTADTFERELEIRVNRASFQLRSSETGDDLHTFNDEVQGLMVRNEEGPPSSDALSDGDIIESGEPELDGTNDPDPLSAEGSSLDDIHQHNHFEEGGVRNVPEIPESKEGSMGGEDAEGEADQNGDDSEASHISDSSMPSDAYRGIEQANCVLGPRFKGDESIIEPSQEATYLEEPGASDEQTAQKHGEEDLDAQLNKLYVAELREKLRKMNGSTAGRKADLVKRLKQMMEDSADNSVSKGLSTKEKSDEAVSDESKSLASSEGEVTESESTVIATASDSDDIFEGEEKPEDTAELYRRKTVKELRQILKDNNLDTMSKLRKEDLIQHMVVQGIKLPGQHQEISNIESPSSERVLRSTRKTRQTPAASRRRPPLTAKGAPPTAKSLNRLTVAELRLRLIEQSLCRQGTKRVLIDRILSGRGTMDENDASNSTKNSTCKSCRVGGNCDVENKD